MTVNNSQSLSLEYPIMILDEIIAHKRPEVDAARSRVPLDDIKARAADAAPVRPFTAALQRPDGRMGLIAEVKKASPSLGVIQANFDPVAIASAYAQGGADCLSVLTDERFFQGSLSDLVSARQASGLPVLRKDFTISDYQIYEARAYGADAILLIVAVLSATEIADFSALAAELGMAVLVETHTEAEMTVAVESGAKVIGINSRDLQTFKTDLAVIERLAPLAGDALLVGESGIKTRADVARLAAAGVKAILVGETLMRAPNISDGVREFVETYPARTALPLPMREG